MNRMHVGILAVVLVCGLVMGGAAAQSSEPPLILLIDHDLWTWQASSGELRQMTHSEYVQGMNLAPDGARLAYTRYPDKVVTLIRQQSGLARARLPTDVWLFDIEVGTGSQIAGQPANASFAQAGAPDVYTIRSTPVWSPDGTRLAWTEYGEQAEPQRVMVYDFDSGQTSVYVDGLVQGYGVPAPLDLMWAEAGMVIHNWLPYVNPQTGQVTAGQFVRTFQIASLPGEIPLVVQVPETAERQVVDYLLAYRGDSQYIAIHYNRGDWDLLDPLTAQFQYMPEMPGLHSANGGETSYRMYLAPEGDYGPNNAYVLSSTGENLSDILPLGFDSLTWAAASPDGRGFAYTPDDPDSNYITVNIWLDGEEHTILLPAEERTLSGFVWGPAVWRFPNPFPGIGLLFIATPHEGEGTEYYVEPVE